MIFIGVDRAVVDFLLVDLGEEAVVFGDKELIFFVSHGELL